MDARRFPLLTTGCLAACLAMAGCSSAPPTPQHVLLEQSRTALDAKTRVRVAVDEAAPVMFLGQLPENDGNIGHSTTVLYPGDNAAVFLTAVLTHAAMNSSVQASLKAQRQTEANQVLQPYKTMLDAFDHKTLVEGSEPLLPENLRQKFDFSLANEDGKQPQWIVESAPAFILAADKSAVKLRHAIIARAADDPGTIHYQNVVEVISERRPEDATDAYWSDSARLLNTSAQLYATSVELAYLDMARQLNTTDTAEKTFVYAFGPRTLYKRSRLAFADCERYTIRSLRGWLITAPDLAKDDCEPAAGEISTATLSDD